MVKKVLEKHIENPVVMYAKTKGMDVLKMNGMGYRSWPDRFFFYKEGSLFFIEFKRPGEVPTEKQARKIADLRKRGFRVYVVDDVPEGKVIIDKEVARVK